jgi:hypothetical protein
VIEKYGSEAKGEELDAFAKRYVSDQFMQYGHARTGRRAAAAVMAARMLGDREQIGRIRNTIVEQKLITHFKATAQPQGEQSELRRRS